MAVKVVDASAVAAILFGESEGAAVSEIIQGHELIAPKLLPFELSNVCRKKMRGEPDKSAAFVAGFLTRSNLHVLEVSVAHDEVVMLAEAKGLSAYDASYLWLATHLAVELVTLDKQLAKAAAA